LSNVNATDKCVSICADNSNCNFGGASRKGVNNIFTKLKESPPHVIHNTIEAGTHVLPVGTEDIVSKIYSNFYLYTVRVENLKEFCELVNQEYKEILGYSKTRWLALLPADGRHLNMFLSLKYFSNLKISVHLFIKAFF
jgi:hypothetical protein